MHHPRSKQQEIRITTQDQQSANIEYLLQILDGGDQLDDN